MLAVMVGETRDSLTLTIGMNTAKNTVGTVQQNMATSRGKHSLSLRRVLQLQTRGVFQPIQSMARQPIQGVYIF
jgi:hypothetical protein